MDAGFILTVTRAEYAGGYKIRTTFNDGSTKIVDFADIAQQGKGICYKLKDLDYFTSFTLDPFTIDWHNEIGFAPEYLYEIGQAA